VDKNFHSCKKLVLHPDSLRYMSKSFKEGPKNMLYNDYI
jgi:hypothetical protein